MLNFNRDGAVPKVEFGTNVQRSMLEERYLQGVMFFFLAMSTTLIPVRLLYLDWIGLGLVQWVICMSLAAALRFRGKLPALLVAVGTTCTILTIEFIDISQDGLSSPAILGLTVLPVGNTVVWGRRAGILSLVATSALFLVVGAHYQSVHPEEFANSPLVGHVPLSWIIASAGLFACGIWGIVVVIMQRNFWTETVEKLRMEHDKRMSVAQRKREVEQRWLALSRNIRGVIFDYVRLSVGKDEIRHMSEGCRDLLELEPKAIEGDIQVLLKCMTPETVNELNELFTHSRQDLTSASYQMPILTPSGKRKWIHGQAQPVAGENGEMLWHCLFLDVTREVEAEAEAHLQTQISLQAQKQESIGQLTGGVAHDFNNLLAIILGNLELAKDELADNETRRFIEKAISAIDRGANLTKNMLAFSRQAPLSPKLLDLNTLIQTTHDWIGRTIPENCEIETSFLAGLWKTNIDESSTVSALINLLVNARDAMPDGGKITIETSNIRVNKEYVEIRHEEIEPGRYVLVSVSDTGTGIAAEYLDSIFDPFFTTKAPGKGSGLGLAMIFGFMKQSGGTVRVYSEVGVGTSFKLYFPAYTEGSLPFETDERLQTVVATKGAKLLLVEDEKVILNTMEQTLSRLGYVVTTASSGDEAAVIFENNNAFDIMVTDIVMPGTLQGTTLAKKLREIRDDLPVVFMSGYASEATVHGNGLRVDDVRLMKPVARRDLVEGIESALKKSKRGSL